MNLAEAFLLDQVPLAQRASVPTTLKNAYAAANLIVSQEPTFNVESAKANKGRIIQWAVDFALRNW